ncbi:MAG: ATP-binding protein, partial [Methanoregula sp.]|nr:ATP-binding protein [Methanoregula sp.]
AQVSFARDVGGIRLLADPMVETVFANLLDNSVRHGEHVTKVRVFSRREGTTLVVVWEDDGIGIAASDKEKIFGRGYGKNTGLGLFLVREVLGLTGIAVRETGEPGKGARFEIIVPEGAYRLDDPA